MSIVHDDRVELSFADLGLSPELVAALAVGKIISPFPIQAICIPPALRGLDICGKAKTGSGKTLAFGLPMLMRVSPGSPGRPRGLVLVPTRELALQVCKVLRPLGDAVGVRLGALYGGASMDAQTKQLRRGVDIVVATPGRLIDLGERGELSVADLEILVLDEADRMADMGFLPQVEWVLRRLDHEHQTLLFSATLDRDVDHLVRHYLRQPVYCEPEADQRTVEEMEHRFIQVHQLDKVKVVAAIAAASQRTLVFVRTKRGADRLVDQLKREAIRAAAIHGDLRQPQRERALKDFIGGRHQVLVATDVAARGIHVDGIDVVIHYDPPQDHKAYLHRSGRTARAGESGLVVTLVLWDQRLEAERMMKHIGLHQPVVEMFSNDARLRDLSSWQPEGRRGLGADPSDRLPAGAKAAVARNQRLRTQRGRRSGRR